MATQYSANFGDTVAFSDTGAKVFLAASTAATWTVPGPATHKYRAGFTYSSADDIWICNNGTATLPTAGTVTNTYNEELRPTLRFVKGGDVLSFISSTAVQVGVSLLSIPG